LKCAETVFIFRLLFSANSFFDSILRRTSSEFFEKNKNAGKVLKTI
jgi:hypothetical protein